MKVFINTKDPLAARLQRNGLGQIVHALRDAVTHGLRSLRAGRMVVAPVFEPVLSVLPHAPQPLHGSEDLGLKSDDDEDEHALKTVYDVGRVPDLLRTADGPRDHVRYPRHSHHDHQLHANSSEGRPEIKQPQ